MINDIKELIDEYIKTLSDDFEDERFSSPRGFAQGELEEFLEWLETIKKIDHCDCGRKLSFRKICPVCDNEE